MNKPNTVTPHPYRVARQADQLEQRDIKGSWLDARMDRFLRRVLLRALRKHGNKSKAAIALGVTYRTFRYHWARLLMDDIYHAALTTLISLGRFPTDDEANTLVDAIGDYLGRPDDEE